TNSPWNASPTSASRTSSGKCRGPARKPARSAAGRWPRRAAPVSFAEPCSGNRPSAAEERRSARIDGPEATATAARQSPARPSVDPLRARQTLTEARTGLRLEHTEAGKTRLVPLNDAAVTALRALPPPLDGCRNGTCLAPAFGRRAHS